MLQVPIDAKIFTYQSGETKKKKKHASILAEEK